MQTCPAFTLMPVAAKGCVPLAAVNTGVPQSPLVVGTGGLAIVSPAGSVSVNAIPARLTVSAALLSTENTSVVVWPRPTVAAPNALVRTGRGLIVTHCGEIAFVTFTVPVMLAAAFVNGGGRAPHALFEAPVLFTTSWILIVQDAVPAVMATFVKAAVSVGDPEKATEPEHPAPQITVGTAGVKTRLEGKVSVKAMPPCAGLPAPAFASTKTIELASSRSRTEKPKVLVRVACVTVSAWFVTPFTRPEIAVTCAAPFDVGPRRGARHVHLDRAGRGADRRIDSGAAHREGARARRRP